MDKIKEFILNKLQKKYTIEHRENIDDMDYVEEGYVDSIGMVQFIVELETEFGIEFADEDVQALEFRKIGTLSELVSKKLEEK